MTSPRLNARAHLSFRSTEFMQLYHRAHTPARRHRPESARFSMYYTNVSKKKNRPKIRDFVDVFTLFFFFPRSRLPDMCLKRS